MLRKPDDMKEWQAEAIKKDTAPKKKPVVKKSAEPVEPIEQPAEPSADVPAVEEKKPAKRPAKKKVSQ